MTDPFNVGDEVNVLRACRLPKVEEVIGRGTITRVTHVSTTGEAIYWITGFAVGRSARELRKPA